MIAERTSYFCPLATLLIWRSELHGLEVGGFRSSHAAVIRVYDPAGDVIETHKHAGDFRG